MSSADPLFPDCFPIPSLPSVSTFISFAGIFFSLCLYLHLHSGLPSLACCITHGKEHPNVRIDRSNQYGRRQASRSWQITHTHPCRKESNRQRHGVSCIQFACAQQPHLFPDSGEGKSINQTGNLKASTQTTAIKSNVHAQLRKLANPIGGNIGWEVAFILLVRFSYYPIIILNQRE